MIVTRIVRSKGLNPKKLDALTHIADLLGEIRTEAWDRYGSIAGAGRDFISIRNDWTESGRTFKVPSQLWRTTLSDTITNIATSRAAAKEKIKHAIFLRTKAAGEKNNWNKERLENERGSLFTLLKCDEWMRDDYLRSMMRKHFPHGHTQVDNQIVLDSQSYKWFEYNEQGWIEVISLKRNGRIAIPLASNWPISGRIRLIINPGASEIEIHYCVEEAENNSCGKKAIGVDKGYTEVLTDSDGERHGVGLGKILTVKTDADNLKYQRRNRIQAIANKSNPAKKARIYENNLGRKKVDHQRELHRQAVKTVVHRAVHSVVDKAKVIVAEDLTVPIRERKRKKNRSRGKGRGKNRRRGPKEKRRLHRWVKGTIAKALENISRRRGSAVCLVNCAYTSQVCPRCGCLAERKGDWLHCLVCGDVTPSDHSAAQAILARKQDPEIGRWTPYQKVKSILQERACQRLRLPNQDSSCINASTESESSAIVTETRRDKDCLMAETRRDKNGLGSLNCGK